VFRTNVTATYTAVEAATLARARRFVYASSFSVLGYPFFERAVEPPTLPVDETHPIGAQDPYALSKWLGEEIVAAAVRRGAFAAVSLRMPWIQTPERFFREVEPRRRTPDAARDLWSYIDARDAAEAFAAAIARPTQGHLRLFLSAADTFMAEDTEPLVRRTYPDATLTRPIPGGGAVIDTTAAHLALGFTPRHSWRDYAPVQGAGS
jgi:nucleoside-diphosphate-sugar epimerase